MFQDRQIKESNRSQKPFPPLEESNVWNKKNAMIEIKEHCHTFVGLPRFSADTEQHKHNHEQVFWTITEGVVLKSKE